jgi:hypothetical protein
MHYSSCQEEANQYVTNKMTWKLKSGVFCSFNAFRRLDVRVEVRIPGGVDCYTVDLRGERFIHFGLFYKKSTR